MAKKKIFRFIQAGLAAFAVAVAMPSCTDDHFDVRDGNGADANASLTIWEQIEGRRNKDLQRFATIVEQTPYFKDEAHMAYKDEAKTQPYTYKDVLNGTQILTVFAPTDDAFTEEEYQEYLTLLKGSMSDKYDVYLRLVGNHICRNRYTATGTGEEKLIMINGKKATFNRSAKTFKDQALLEEDGQKLYNLPAVNGVLHLISEQSSFSYNLYEYIKAHGDQFSMLKKWITSHDTIYFNASASVENGSDANGNPIYVDSVYLRTNTLFSYAREYSAPGETWVMNLKTMRGNLEEEDSVWAFAAPTDAAWNNFTTQYDKCYNYAPIYVNKEKEDEGNTENLPRTGFINPDSLKELAMNMDITSMMLFNIRQQPRSLTHLGYWSADEFQEAEMPKIFNTRNDTLAVEAPATDVKPLIFGNAAPEKISNGLLYTVNEWNLYKAKKALDVEVKLSTQSLFQMESMTGTYSNTTFNSERSKLANDSLLGRISDDYFLTFTNSDAAPSINVKLIDNENNHQVMSGIEYEIGIVLVPEFYRWSTDSIIAITGKRAALKNKLAVRIKYNDTAEGATKVSESDTKFRYNIEYEGLKVDTIWTTTEGTPMTVTFPNSYRNITKSYPTMNLSSNAKTTDVNPDRKTNELPYYQHAFSIDRIILRAKE